MSVFLTTLPAAAQADYAEYVRRGGRFDPVEWWARYQDYYERETT